MKNINSNLKVLEAYTRDVGRGTARINQSLMDSLTTSTGDVIEIRDKGNNKRRTVAKCLSLFPADEGKEIIRIDFFVRNNAGVIIGDTVSVRKVKKVIPAKKVIVKPLEVIPPIDERYLTEALESVPLIKGDNFMVPYFGGRLNFKVIAVTPATTADSNDIAAVLVTRNTTFNIKVVDVDDHRQKQQQQWAKLSALTKYNIRINTSGDNLNPRWAIKTFQYYKVTAQAWNQRWKLLAEINDMERVVVVAASNHKMLENNQYQHITQNIIKKKVEADWFAAQMYFHMSKKDFDNCLHKPDLTEVIEACDYKQKQNS